MTSIDPKISRRSFLASSGIFVAFSIAGPAVAQLAGGGEGGPGPKIVAEELHGSLRSAPFLDSWIQIDASGHATVFTGKAELGQGIKTALLQVAAEELHLRPDQVTMVTVDTARTPDEGLTAGSHSMQDSGTAIRNAAANVRILLLRNAAKTLGVADEQLTTSGDGTVRAFDGRSIAYGEVAASMSLHVEADANIPLRKTIDFRSMGTNVPRLDIPAKLTGGPAFIQDMRLDGMLHARVIRGPSEGTRIELPSRKEIEAVPGVFSYVRNGDFHAVVAEKEWDAIRVMRTLQGSTFKSTKKFPTTDIADTLKSLPSREIIILENNKVSSTAKKLTAQYSRPWISHGSIGPSCAVALFKDDLLTVWSHSQGVYGLRRVISDLLKLPVEKIRIIHVEGSGCYGHNGADDVAADAAIIAMDIPGRPIKLQWMREQEFGWEPLGPGMVVDLEAGLGVDNRVSMWNFDVWSNPHNNRPTVAGATLAGTEVDPPFPVPEGKPIPMPEGDGSRNSNPIYDIPANVNYHFIKDMPVRVSALRSLGAHLNVFAIESMFDELALAGAVDPLDLRLQHTSDVRAAACMRNAAEAFNWRSRRKDGPMHGFGMAFARYKNLGAYCAVFMEVVVEEYTGSVKVKKVVSSVDCGEPVSPDGIRNQIEGAIIQSLSWCTHEQVGYTPELRAAFDWSRYPILRFDQVPVELNVIVAPGAGEPFLGVAEAGQGPASAAYANALMDAIGVRFRDMPITENKVRAAIATL